MRKLWLIANPSSGSNSDGALEQLMACLRSGGFEVDRVIRFPDEDAPSASELAAAGVGLVATFAGDGTINATVSGLYGWDGAVLILPGGTMNLFSRRLHGEAPYEDIIAAVAAGAARKVRPTVVRGRRGDAFAGLLAGPGTSWNEVREALRDTNLPGIVEGATRALEETLAGSPVVCAQPPLGQREGYPLLMISPGDTGLEVVAYDADSAGEYLRQGVALLKRDFRQGPHEHLGTVAQLDIADAEGEPIGLLIDGEETEGDARETFRLARCGVDLLATDS